MNSKLMIKQLSVFHQQTNRILIDSVNLSVDEGEVVALVGASGSGKSLIAQAVLQLLPDNLRQTGILNYQSRPITKKDRGQNIVLIPQSIDALDPLMKVKKQIQSLLPAPHSEQKVFDLLGRLGLEEEVASRYPFQLSGGQARRILVAIALGSAAKVVIADEPTPGLDVDSKTDMLSLLKEVKASGKSILLITHDFDVAVDLADRIAVIKDGKIIENTLKENFVGKGERLFHPYTKALWQALPKNLFIRSL
ncbi:ATP-binding cassette domain-containing protein [Gracilibacillus kekensis]|uniref:Nickel import system ATP-binding protein NikD n=1 Tax=Gracilibacillus kekensis TaxID=1027249 RepID=A0A1M7PXM8_9BACI|nr:ATP-binding cassette domain-containing protein [Gracilibacillus kekensis]SHN22360.1 peptide/nickel transport system ATP-binding protein [Gracilibacillus kekensis]